MNYLEKLRKAREFIKEINGHTFTLSRPTDADVTTMKYDDIGKAMEGCSKFVKNWDLVESDLFPGGANEPVSFAEDLFVEWIKDRPEYWEPIINALLDAHKAHREKADSMGNV